MKRIKAKFEVVTPCFLGGANHEEEAELRLPSIKGVLRFWWRALNYARIAQTKQKKNNDIIASLREKEGKLFGTSDPGKDQGQSSLIMRLSAGSQKPSEIKAGEVLCDKPGKVVGIGARYLGYGVMEAFASKKQGTQAGELTRPCLKAPFEFTLQIGAKNQEHLEDVLPALKLLGLLGGLGSKSRKGYGSLNLMELKVSGVDTWQKPANENQYKNQLSDLLKPTLDYGKEPEISAFYFQTRICLTKFKHQTSMEVINSYGREMQDYRRGKKGKEVFGLPQGKVKPEEHERRASPLFFHVHKIGSEFVGVALLLQSRFLPKGERISAKWEMLMDFLNKICDKNKSIWP